MRFSALLLLSSAFFVGCSSTPQQTARHETMAEQSGICFVSTVVCPPAAAAGGLILAADGMITIAEPANERYDIGRHEASIQPHASDEVLLRNEDGTWTWQKHKYLF